MLCCFNCVETYFCVELFFPVDYSYMIRALEKGHGQMRMFSVPDDLGKLALNFHIFVRQGKSGNKTVK